MMYLKILLEDKDVSSSTLEPDEDDFQGIEEGVLLIVRWNETKKRFEHLIAESETDPKDEQNVNWLTDWEAV